MDLPSFGKVAQVTFALSLPTSIILVYLWYKNKSNEDFCEKEKPTASADTVIEMKIPQQAVGAVIGRQGTKITQIQEETGANMYFKNTAKSDGDNKYRILVIQGNQESANLAELTVLQITAYVSQVFTKEIQVPSYAIGRLIGKGGGTIKEMILVSGAKIVIGNSESMEDPDLSRTVSITGSRQEIDIAMEQIKSRLKMEEQYRAKMAETVASRVRKINKKSQNNNQINSATNELVTKSSTEEPQDESFRPCLPGQEKLLIDTRIEVFVSAVEHPGHFWVQLIGNMGLQLELLQNDITTFASSNDAKLNYRLTEVKTGDLVASMYEDGDLTYYRAKVLKETEDGKVDLYFVDFGDNAYVKKEDIFRLRSDFINLPFQAIECSLAQARPVGGKWSEEAITAFETLTYCTKWTPLLAHVVSYKTVMGDHQMPELKLFDKNGEQKIDIGVALIKQGLALPVKN